MARCVDFEEKLTLYIDQELTEEETREIAEHLEVCESCKSFYNELLQMISQLKNLDEIDLPPGFHRDVMTKINRSPKAFILNRAFNFRSNLQGIAVAAAGMVAVLFIMSIVGNIFLSNLYMNDNTSVPMGVAEISPYSSNTIIMPETASEDDLDLIEQRSAVVADVAESESISIAGTTGKQSSSASAWQDVFIKTYNVIIETENFDQAMQVIASLPGHSANLSTNSYANMDDRSAYTTRRINDSDYEYGKEILKTLGKVLSENESINKVSIPLLDLQVSEKTKQEEIDRLFNILQKSDSLAVMTTVGNRLEEATGELDHLRAQILQYTNESAMPYLNIEVISNNAGQQSEKERNFSEKVKTSFVESINFSMVTLSGSAIFISSIAFPVFIVLVVIWVLVAMVRRFRGGRRHE